MRTETIVVGPQDRVIVTTDMNLTRDQRASIEAHLKERLGTERVAILDGGLCITVVREAA